MFNDLDESSNISISRAKQNYTKVFTISGKVMFCAIWYNLYNLKNVKNTHVGVLLY